MTGVSFDSGSNSAPKKNAGISRLEVLYSCAFPRPLGAGFQKTRKWRQPFSVLLLLECFLLDPHVGCIWEFDREEGETEIGTGFPCGIGYSQRVNGLKPVLCSTERPVPNSGAGLSSSERAVALWSQANSPRFRVRLEG